jgi:hypothetical protein
MGFELPMKNIDLNKTQTKNPMADGAGTVLLGARTLCKSQINQTIYLYPFLNRKWIHVVL